MGSITISDTAPQNYYDAIEILNQSETFRSTLDQAGDVTLTAESRYSTGLAAPAWAKPLGSYRGVTFEQNGWQANVHPESGVLIDGRMATLPELIAHEIAEGAVYTDTGQQGIFDPSKNIEAEIQVIEIVNQIRSELGSGYPQRTDLLRSNVGSSVQYIDFVLGYNTAQDPTGTGTLFQFNGHILVPIDAHGDFKAYSSAMRSGIGLTHDGRLRELYSSHSEYCFKCDTPIQMWPLDPPIKPHADGTYNEQLVLSKIWEKPISEVRVGDLVVSYDNDGRIKPGAVSRTMTNTATHLLDFWNTGATPGHAYYCADGKFKGQHVPILDILRTDGAIMKQDETKIRAATNCEVGSEGDDFVHAIVGDPQPDGSIFVTEHKRIRLGTRIFLDEQNDYSVLDLIKANGGQVTDDGYIVTGEGGQKLPFNWTFTDSLPKPEDYILRRSDVTLEEIYAADEWEQIGTRMPAPDGLAGFNPNSTMKRTKPKPNIPPAIADRPDTPSAKNRAQRAAHASASPSAPGMNRKQRKAMEAKQRKAANVRKHLASRS